ncbi:MAG: exodeoxyribonuclease VII small subunit [Acidimicrobiales bacterium]
MSRENERIDTELAPVSELSYADAAAELDDIVAELDEGRVDVDVLEARFRRAIEIVEELDKRIRGVRERVDELMPRLAALGEDEEEEEDDE